MKKLFFTVVSISLFAAASFAQTREPSKPLRDYVVKTNQEVLAVNQALGKENKVTDLIGGEGLQTRVAIQHDEKKDSATAEVHDASDDVFYVLDGSAELTLGGKLDNPREATPGCPSRPARSDG